ncbi:cytochrome P450 [Sporichthya brevicatena]|uniref:Cytochrome P450 n=1 Tax=Sporichthya brevicatena TaxID=171442 RepID=A0ABN1GI44_9ACTN
MRFEMRDPGVAQEPGPYYASLREQCPVAHIDDYGGFYLLSTYENVCAAAKNTTVFSSTGGVTIPKQPMPPLVCIEQDEPEHSRYRRPLQQWLSPRRMAKLEDSVRGIVDGLIDTFVHRGEADLARELCEPVPPLVMALLMGLPDSDWHIFRDQMSRIVGHSAAEDPEAATVATNEFVDYLAAQLEDRAASPRDDLMTDIATLEIEGVPLTFAEQISMAFLLLGAGHETTVGGIGGLLYYLARDPSIAEQLKANPSLIPGAAEEAVRLMAPLPGLARNTLAEATVDDVTIPAGSKVLLLWGSANRDPAEFENPEEFMLGRDSNRHVGFGQGIHRCVGAPLARLELKVVLEQVLARMPNLRLAGEGAAIARFGTSRSYQKLLARWDTMS